MNSVIGINGSIHPLYSGAYIERNNLGILHLPKNASSSIKRALKPITNKTEIILKDFTIDKFCVILRDPVERFISAVNMYLHPRTITSNYVDIRKEDNKYSIFKSNDAHFFSQNTFIEGLDKSKIDFFWLNNNIINDLNDFYDLNMEQNYINRFSKIIKSVDIDIIKDVYVKDYELIDSVKFVNKVDNGNIN
jgi:hypothetical protein